MFRVRAGPGGGSADCRRANMDRSAARRRQRSRWVAVSGRVVTAAVAV